MALEVRICCNSSNLQIVSIVPLSNFEIQKMASTNKCCISVGIKLLPINQWCRQGLSRDDVTREMCNTWKCDRLIASVILCETIGEMVSRITGWSSVRIAQDDLIWKPPGQQKTTVGHHQDGTYISEQFVPRENNSVTVWIALDDVTEEMGCVEYAVGSHLWQEKVRVKCD